MNSPTFCRRESGLRLAVEAFEDEFSRERARTTSLRVSALRKTILPTVFDESEETGNSLSKRPLRYVVKHVPNIEMLSCRDAGKEGPESSSGTCEWKICELEIELETRRIRTRNGAAPVAASPCATRARYAQSEVRFNSLSPQRDARQAP